MEDIKNFLERLSVKNWIRVRDCERVKEYLTEEALDKELDYMIEKLEKCLEIQERNIQTLEHINEIISK